MAAGRGRSGPRRAETAARVLARALAGGGLLLALLAPAGAQPAYVIPWLTLCQGEALAALGRHEAAVAALEEARRGARLQAFLPLAWQIERSLGRAYRQQRRLKEAQAAFAAARHDIARLAASIDDGGLRAQFEQAALATLQREVRLQPSNPEPWLRLGDFLFNKLDQPAEALKSVRTALYLDPRNPQIIGAYLVVLRATQGKGG